MYIVELIPIGLNCIICIWSLCLFIGHALNLGTLSSDEDGIIASPQPKRTKSDAMMAGAHTAMTSPAPQCKSLLYNHFRYGALPDIQPIGDLLETL